MTGSAPAGGAATLTPERLGDLSCLRFCTGDGASLLISPLGAQVLSWRPAGGSERLFLSARAALDGQSPIRGGVPLVFPQFGNLGPLPAHGLARTAPWQAQGMRQHADGASVTLVLRGDAALRAQWPHAFSCQLCVRLGGASLQITWRIDNPGSQAFTFQAALHTYLRVADADQTHIEGLQGAAYLDRRADGRPGVQHPALLGLAGGLDRTYPGAPRRLLLVEPAATVEVCAEGFPDLVVWNPGPLRAAAIADLEPEGQRRMVCIEAAAVVQAVRLSPSQSWSGCQRLTLLA